MAGPRRESCVIDEDYEASLPTPSPLCEPRLVSALGDTGDDDDDHLSSHNNYSSRSMSVSTSVRAKHESYDLSGSVFLITGDGRKIDLPVPSESKADPLNWGRWKTAGAMGSLWWYSVVSLTAVQAATMMLKEILNDYKEEVCFFAIFLPFN